MPILLVETPDAEGALLHVITHGHGPTMLVLHGGLGLEHTYLRPGLDPLADLTRLAYLDMRGNGRSRERSGTWTSLTMDRLVADVEAVRCALDSEQLLLFGHSFGAAIAQEYALAHPDRVSGIVLCSGYMTFDVGDLAGRAAERATPEAREAFAALLSGMATSDEKLATLFRGAFPLYCHDASHAPTFALDHLNASFQAFVDSATRLMPEFSTRARLSALAAPTLVVCGDDDFAAPLELASEPLARELPNGELALISDSGHFPFLEQPAAFQSVMRSWLVQVAGEQSRSAVTVTHGGEQP
jgi:proline iminopeptidase